MTLNIKDSIPVFSTYDRAIVDWLNGIVDVHGNQINRVFAVPSRAFAMMAKKIGEDKVKTIPLPFISINQTDASFDPSRFINRNISLPAASGDPNHIMRVPSPRTYVYDIELWARNKHEIDYVHSQIIDRLNHSDTYLRVDHKPPLGVRLVHVTLDSVENRSNLETGESADRVLRVAFVFSVKGWMYPITNEPELGDPLIKGVYITVDRSSESVWSDTIEVLDSIHLTD